MNRLLFLPLCLCGMHAPAQPALDTLRYVDFHIHTTNKNYYRDVPKPEMMNDPAFVARCRIDTANWNGFKHQEKLKSNNGFSGFHGKASYPQASYDILQGSGASVLFTSFIPPEKLYTSNKLLLFFPMRLINRLFVTRMKMRRQRTAFNRSPFQEFKGELSYLTHQAERYGNHPRSVVPVGNKQELKEALDQEKIALVLSLEGGHILHERYNTHRYRHYDCDDNNVDCFREIIENINWIKYQQPYKPFFITFAHMTWNRLAGQAKSFDSDKAWIRWLLLRGSGFGNFRLRLFNKHAVGIVDTFFQSGSGSCSCLCGATPRRNARGFGKEVLEKLLDTPGGKRILIDMRHMDVQARLDYMQYVNEKRQKGVSIPLIISHAAVSGKDSNQARVLGHCPVADRYGELTRPDKYYQRWNGKCKACGTHILKNPVAIDKVGWFHPWSVNLFNEEIEAVYKSNGIIGVTLEERVLGTGSWSYKKRDKKAFKDRLRQEGFNNHDIDTFCIAEPLMRNILYVVENSGFKNTMRSWEHIALGSDFDGIINPIDICTKASDIPQLYRVLYRHLPVFAKINNKSDLLLKNTDPAVLLNKLFYQNGERFVLQYY